MVLVNNMWIVTNKKIFLLLSLLLVVASVVFIGVRGLNLGIDFVGGSLTEISYPEGRPELSEIRTQVSSAGFLNAVVQPIGDRGVSIKTQDLNEAQRVSLFDTLGVGEVSVEESFTSIGPSIGKELQSKAVTALIMVSLAIVLFIAYVFRGVSKPISSWKYGAIAVVTLLHDVILTTGAFALVGLFTGTQIDSLFIVALLTVLGLSVNDTIVVFDRIRENLKENISNKSFTQIVGMSLSQTYTRSINTSLSTIIVLVALVIWGPESTKMFALALSFGMFFGTYSSVFIASPLLVLVYERQKLKQKKTPQVYNG